MKHDDSVYLQHILDATERVDFYLRGKDEAAFRNDTLVQDGVIRQLEIIGEATKHLSLGLRKLHPEIPWEDIAGMRDKLIHHYFGVDVEKVWLTAAEDLPVLRLQIEKLLAV